MEENVDQIKDGLGKELSLLSIGNSQVFQKGNGIFILFI